jgi:hypothetical protein
MLHLHPAQELPQNPGVDIRAEVGHCYGCDGLLHAAGCHILQQEAQQGTGLPQQAHLAK